MGIWIKKEKIRRNFQYCGHTIDWLIDWLYLAFLSSAFTSQSFWGFSSPRSKKSSPCWTIRASTRFRIGFSTDSATSRTANSPTWWPTIWSPRCVTIWSGWRRFAIIAVCATTGACECAASTPRLPVGGDELSECPRRRAVRLGMFFFWSDDLGRFDLTWNVVIAAWILEEEQLSTNTFRCFESTNFVSWKRISWSHSGDRSIDWLID